MVRESGARHFQGILNIMWKSIMQFMRNWIQVAIGIWKRIVEFQCKLVLNHKKEYFEIAADADHVLRTMYRKITEMKTKQQSYSECFTLLSDGFTYKPLAFPFYTSWGFYDVAVVQKSGKTFIKVTYQIHGGFAFLGLVLFNSMVIFGVVSLASIVFFILFTAVDMNFILNDKNALKIGTVLLGSVAGVIMSMMFFRLFYFLDYKKPLKELLKSIFVSI